MPQQVSRHPGVIDRVWLLARLEAIGMSQRGLARRLHVDAASVSRLAHGRRHLTFEEAVELARILVVPVREVIAHAGIDLDGPAVPLADYSVDYGPQVIHLKPGGVI